MLRRLLLLIVLIGLATLASLCARWFWFAELFSHFLLHGLVATALLLTLVVLFRAKRLAVAAVMVLGLQLGLLFGRPIESPRMAACYDLRLVQWNVEFTNPKPDEGVAWLRNQRADVIVLLEVGPSWLPALQSLAQDYTVVHLEPADHPFGLAVFSRLPASRMTRLSAPSDSFPWVQLDAAVAGRPLRLNAVHAPPPVSSELAEARNTLLTKLASSTSAEPAGILVGDFNMTPWSPWFDDILRSGLVDARQGLQATWPSWADLAGLPIDHTLVTSSIDLQSRRVGPDLSSDHLPVISDLAVGCAR